LSAPALGGTGLSLDGNGVLVGTPTEVTPLSTLSVIASAVGSPATATRDVSFAILDDSFTFADVAASSLEFIQNVRITDVGFPVTTLSDRNVIGYSQTGFPTGLTINSAGIVSGTPTTASPTAGNVTITATTGFASGFRDFSYNITPDAVLLFSPVSTLNLTASELVGPIRIEGVSYSGKTVSNYQFVNLSETYGLTIGSNSGILNGTLGSGFPPDAIFPIDSNFQIKALAGDVSAALDVRFQTINPYINRSFVTLQTVAISTGELVTSSIYFSDNLSNWTLIPGFADVVGTPLTDFRVNYTNPNSNQINYLQYAPTPPPIQRYTNGPDFTQVGNSSRMRAFTTDGSGTWWAVVNARMENEIIDPNPSDGPSGGEGGIVPSGGGTPVTNFIGNIAKSEDNGVTWTDLSDIPGQGSLGAIVYSPRVIPIGIEYTSHPYRTLGISLRYKDDVLLLGGGTRATDPSNDGAISSALMRSVNNGATWTTPTQFEEVAGFNLDDNNVWLAYGSTLYQTDGSLPTSLLPATTIKYSQDLGVTWSNASNTSEFFTYDITYGNGTWIATGLRENFASNFSPDIRFSSNGSNWHTIDLSTNALFFNGLVKPPVGIGPTMFNGTSWNVFVTRPLDLSDGNSDIRTELYRHDADTDLSGNWTAIDLSGSFPDVPAGEVSDAFNTRLFLGFTPDNLIKQNGDPIPFLTFTTGTGPTFTAPTTTSYLQYQYIPIPTIQISATGVGQIYYFVTAADLPPGLSFDPITARITGAPVQIGTVSVTVFAKDDNGASQLTLSFTTVIPRIIRKQDGAAAYTSLLRQYTEVLAAQSARDNRALPTEMRTLGEFMSPVPPPVVTPSNCPC
jgi:hypothetical protein